MGKLMKTELKPSKSIWKYFKGEITSLQIVSGIADMVGGYHISYSNKELLKDLGFITSKGRVSNKAKTIVAWYLHEKYHGSICPIKVIDPTKSEGI